jgi:hypothetical protein
LLFQILSEISTSMKKLVVSLVMILALLGAAAVFTTYGPHLLAQEPADQAVTRPDHMGAGDWGTCNEGETGYNTTLHAGRRCTAANTWATVVTAPAGDSVLTANTAIGISAQRVCHVTYSFAVDGGATPIVPANNCVLPANAVITNVGVQQTSATGVTAVGSATVAIGCVGGTACGASSLMAATAKASLGSGAFGQSIPVPQTASTWVKTTASGGVQLTIATGPLTAGLLEIYCFYYLSSS